MIREEDHGRRTKDGGRQTVDDRRQKADGGRWTMDGRDHRRWTIDDGWFSGYNW